jgi:clan AA aspartic protease (TIGR02281 family)
MRFERDAPVILLNVLLVGPRAEVEVDMALDTGATYTMIPWDLAERLGYDPAGSRERANLVTASGTERVPLITLGAVEALGVRVTDVKVACHDLPPTSRVQGLLGLSFLREANLFVRFKDGELELQDP